jgi:hypothetical protein
MEKFMFGCWPTRKMKRAIFDESFSHPARLQLLQRAIRVFITGVAL